MAEARALNLSKQALPTRMNVSSPATCSPVVISLKAPLVLGDWASSGALKPRCCLKMSSTMVSMHGEMASPVLNQPLLSRPWWRRCPGSLRPHPLSHQGPGSRPSSPRYSHHAKWLRSGMELEQVCSFFAGPGKYYLL